MISKAPTKTGAATRACGMLYKEVVKNVLLYGSDSWVVTGSILKVLEGLQHRSAWRITGMTYLRSYDGEWEYPPVADVMEPAGLCPVKEYLQRYKATKALQVVFRPVYEVCTRAERMTVSIQMMRWWDQDVRSEE